MVKWSLYIAPRLLFLQLSQIHITLKTRTWNLDSGNWQPNLGAPESHHRGKSNEIGSGETTLSQQTLLEHLPPVGTCVRLLGGWGGAVMSQFVQPSPTSSSLGQASRLLAHNIRQKRHQNWRWSKVRAGLRSMSSILQNCWMLLRKNQKSPDSKQKQRNIQ